VNRFFYHNIHFTTFVTLFLGRFDPARRTLTYGSAGHNPPLVFRNRENGKDQVSWLRPTGAAIGLVEDFKITAETVGLTPGDILLLYTDGITEATNPQQEEFGQERLAALVGQAAGSSVKDLVRAVRLGLQEFTQGRPLADDATIVACKLA